VSPISRVTPLRALKVRRTQKCPCKLKQALCMMKYAGFVDAHS
jgi:hypothetical protein